MWRGILPCYHVEWRPYGSSAARKAFGENTVWVYHTVVENLLDALDAEPPLHSGGEGCDTVGEAEQAKPHLAHNPLSLLAEYS